MSDAIAIAKTGLDASQKAIDVIADNAANAKTLAYKESMLVTADNFYTTLKKGGLVRSDGDFSSPAPLQKGGGSRLSAISKNMTQGPRKDTDKPFDLYINGGGYFALTLPNNRVGYTRVGAFRITKDRNLVSLDKGYPFVDDINIPIDVPSENVEITSDGEVRNKLTLDTYGQIQLAIFPNAEGLEEIGGGVKLVTDASGEAVLLNPADENNSVGELMQGALEMSNVSQIESLTSLITAQRAYELNLRIISAQNEILQKTNDTYQK